MHNRKIQTSPDGYLIGAYIYRCLKSENMCDLTEIFHVILHASYEKSDLNKVIEEQC